jgi:mono/diheme cytochrome c family protein
MLTATSAQAGLLARTGVTNSLHDMNFYVVDTLGSGDGDVYGRTCVFCHTPHNAQPIDPLYPVPLWNHEYGTADFTTGVYQWATPENLPLVIADPLVGPSRLCMSCHDGTVAVDQHGSAFSGTGDARYQEGSTWLSGPRAIGEDGDLTNDHPIGFSYQLALDERNTADLQTPELALKTDYFVSEIAQTSSQGVYDVHERLAQGRTIGDVLFQGDIMTCSSCHEVHNKENVVQEVGTDGSVPNYFLYGKERDSMICLSCHLK